MQRREFLKGLAASALAAQKPSLASERLPIKKGLVWGMLPSNLSIRERFQLARDAGFEEIEAYTTEDQREAEEIKKAAEATGIRIHSVMNQGHWKYPLSSDDPAVVRKSIDIMKTSMRNAHFWGADVVLLVPAVVNEKVGYRQAWERSQKAIRELLPLAEELKVIIAVEEVWNKFLLSPMEFAEYVDQFNSPWLKAYFDVGNIVLYGYPQDWIRTLGRRIVRLHFKDFRLTRERGRIIGEFVNLLEGDVDWGEVHRALKEIGYQGTATAELRSGDLAYLKDVAQRMEKILQGA